MRRTISFLGAFLLVCTAFGQLKRSVLFLGNSYTAGLPPMIEQMALSAGDTLEFMESTGGGQRLSNHAQNPQTLDEIKSREWDYVVLQEQSQLPSFPESDVKSLVYPFAETLCDNIYEGNSCRKAMFYMTWGRKNGDQSNCNYFPPLCTYQGMDSMLRLRYEYMAKENKAELSPVGAVWREIRAKHSSIELYSPDESHPSQVGMYASACCFYASLFRKDPMGITDWQGLDSTTALMIRTIAKKIVYDSLDRWLIGAYDLKADFTYVNKSQFDFEFTNTSKNSTSQIWEIDGKTDTAQNPSFTFSNGGEKKVKLTVYNRCDSMVIEKDITVYHLNVEGVKLKELIIEPNPAKNYVQIYPPPSQFPQFIEVIDRQGRVVYRKDIKKGTFMVVIDIHVLPKGSYSILLKTKEGIQSKKLLKQ